MGRFSRLETDSPSPEPKKKPRRASAGPDADVGIALGGKEDLPYDVPGLMSRGHEAFFGGDVKYGMRWYSRAMQAEKSCLEAWAAYIRVLLLRGELNEAHVWITRAIGIFPDAPAILSLRAVKHARSGMMTQAIALSDSLLAQNSEELEPWISRGHILTIDGNRNAEFCFQQALHFSSDLDWQVPFMIALILDGERKWSKSIAYYHKALERRSTLPYAWLRMGMAHAKLGQKEASRRDYVRALDLCEDDDRLRRKIEGLSTGSGFSRLLRPFEFLRKRKKAKPPVEDDELDA